MFRGYVITGSWYLELVQVEIASIFHLIRGLYFLCYRMFVVSSGACNIIETEDVRLTENQLLRGHSATIKKQRYFCFLPKSLLLTENHAAWKTYNVNKVSPACPSSDTLPPSL